MFPFESISVNVKGSKTINLEGKLMTDALQYGPTQGYFNFFKEKKNIQFLLTYCSTEPF